MKFIFLKHRFMEFPGRINKNVEIIVPPAKFGEFAELTYKHQMKSRLIIENLQE